MAHYYFDLKNGTTQRDHVGMELTCDRDAIVRAEVMAGQFGSTGGVADHACHISIIREDGHEVMRVPMANAGSVASAPYLKKIA
jgi:hypothetical protein